MDLTCPWPSLRTHTSQFSSTAEAKQNTAENNTRPRQRLHTLWQVLEPHPPQEQSQALFHTLWSSLPQADSKVLAFINIIRKRETAYLKHRRLHIYLRTAQTWKKWTLNLILHSTLLPCFLLLPTPILPNAPPTYKQAPKQWVPRCGCVLYTLADWVGCLKQNSWFPPWWSEIRSSPHIPDLNFSEEAIDEDQTGFITLVGFTELNFIPSAKLLKVPEL